MSGWNRCALVLLALTAGSAAYADTITTLFSSNNSGSPGGGVYFDVTVGALPIEITGFESNANSTAGGENIAFEVYTHAGGSAGFQNSNADWALEATGTGIAGIRDTPTVISLSNPFVLAPNATVGMAITLGPAIGSAYTDGNGANQHYADGNVQLDLGTTNNALFGAGLFSPRVWNGSITYNVIPEPSSLVLLASGCLALLRRRMSWPFFWLRRPCIQGPVLAEVARHVRDGLASSLGPIRGHGDSGDGCAHDGRLAHGLTWEPIP